jgi:GNAT superfamily N-acetyltransferase/RimJ/RimL family protein N-acetyltransferase
VRIERFDPKTDEQQLRACHQMVVSGQPQDDPDGPALSWGMFRAWWAYGLFDEPKEAWLALADDGTAIGCYELDLPDRENKTAGFLYPVVALAHRRHGLGTALTAHAAGRAELAGRTLLSATARTGAPGCAFAAALGASRSSTEARRVLDLGPALAARLAALRAQAQSQATGYRLRYWSGPAPEDLVGQICALEGAMGDAPHEDWYEPPAWDEDRVRAADQRLAEHGARQYSIGAIHPASGELAALTQLTIDPDVGGWAFQGMTAVLRQHRGHRLGLLLKVTMLEQVADLEPQVRQVVTHNDVGNAHMIAVNDSLGHRVTDEFQNFELNLPAAARALIRS